MNAAPTLGTLDPRGGGDSRGGELPREHHKHDVGAEAEEGQERDAVAAGAELLVHVALAVLGGEELPVALVAAVDGDQQHAGPVQREQGADGVEVGREDLEDDEGEAELGQGGPHVRALEGALRGADLDELVRGEDDGAGAVHPQMEVATLGGQEPHVT